MTDLDLRPLNEGAANQLLEQVFAGSQKLPSLPERRAILRASGGNPMAVELLAQDWITHGEAATALSLPAMCTEVPAAALGVSSYDNMLKRLLPDLSPRTRAALNLATILGPRLNDLEFFQLIGLSTAQTILAMNELVDRRILRDSGGGLEFMNELVRGRLYPQIPSSLRVRLHGGVADRLMLRAAAGKPFQGLEIAWHCIRARRRDESIPYLMTGARAAIVSGAPDEAASALLSALPQLRGSVRIEAALLLVETYQEMARWQDALELVLELKHQRGHTSEVQAQIDVSEVACRASLGGLTVEEQRAQVGALMSYTDEGQPSPTRSRAAATIAFMASNIKDADLCSGVYARLLRHQPDEFPLLDRCRFVIARAQMMYQLRQLAPVTSDLRTATRILEEAGAIDSTYIRLNIGLGAIAAAEGRYSEGLDPLRRAYAAAARIDNAHFMCQAAYNLAICSWTLDMEAENSRWAFLAHKASLHLPLGEYERASAANQFGLAQLRQGKEGVERSLTWLDSEIRGSRYPWVAQGAELFRADLNWLIGRQRAALAAASRARSIGTTPLAIGFTGIFTRWSTLLRLRENRAELAAKELEGPSQDIDCFDAKDRLEILLAMKLAYAKLALPVDDLDRRIDALKTQLPVSIPRVMARLGYY
jgi:hypothetical protein